MMFNYTIGEIGIWTFQFPSPIFLHKLDQRENSSVFNSNLEQNLSAAICR